MLEHVLNLGNQLKTDLETSEGFVSVDYERILIVGMGGSGVAGDVLKLILNQHTNIDVEVRKTYNLTKNQIAVRPFCLFISYSGNTEETISVAKDAIDENLEWAAISSGGELLDLAIKHNKKFVKVPDGLQPRAAFGFMTKAVVNYLPNPTKEIFINACEEAGNYLNNLMKDASNEVFEISRDIVSQIGSKTAVIYAGSDLTYLVAQRWKTQINENSKSKAYVGFMPEVHHNEILSWEADQKGSKNNFILILLRGDDYKKIDNRFEFTKELIGSKVDTIDVRNISSDNLIINLFHLVLIGDLVSVNLADQLNIDPFNIDAIENLKKKLKG
ncbi:bifunctional phosphoglucose/phosphomannose isomerase [bacterium]|nr:bifunctional phosphoglucose/phosphomannose isomerase [bacterium]